MSATKELFPWKPEYNVNHAGIDSQHKRLAAIVNKLYAGMSAGKGGAMIGPILTELLEYTKTHFAFEEREMDRVGYPVAAQHKELHRKLVKQVSEMASQWRNEQAVSVVEVAEFLKVWLIQHIGENDRPLASHLGAKGKSAAVAV